jgi:four helix bundle protein
MAQGNQEMGLQTLEVWKASLQFSANICRKILPVLPSEEKWALTSQLRRSVQSIPANIAEGYGRYYYQEAVRFNYIARGSLEETKSHLILAHELGYLDEKTIIDLLKQAGEILRLLNGYIAYLKKSRQGADEPGARTQVRDVSVSYGDSNHDSDTNPDSSFVIDPTPIDPSLVDPSPIDHSPIDQSPFDHSLMIP